MTCKNFQSVQECAMAFNKMTVSRMTYRGALSSRMTFSPTTFIRMILSKLSCRDYEILYLVSKRSPERYKD